MGHALGQSIVDLTYVLKIALFQRRSLPETGTLGEECFSLIFPPTTRLLASLLMVIHMHRLPIPHSTYLDYLSIPGASTPNLEHRPSPWFSFYVSPHPYLENRKPDDPVIIFESCRRPFELPFIARSGRGGHVWRWYARLAHAGGAVAAQRACKSRGGTASPQKIKSFFFCGRVAGSGGVCLCVTTAERTRSAAMTPTYGLDRHAYTVQHPLSLSCGASPFGSPAPRVHIEDHD